MSLSADEENALRMRITHFVQPYPSGSLVLSDCDCTSVSYFFISIVLLILGMCISASALGATELKLFSNLGHMWLIGPICVCCGTMIGIKSFLYLRRKNVIKRLIRQRILIRDIVRDSRCSHVLTQRCSHLTASAMTLPPPYEFILSQIALETPPPSYDSALLNMEQPITKVDTYTETTF
ncbi:uncharacterized protein LOC106669889 isoform X2 [Cimex lectularius]|uniref:Uncharacterized protein n=1 Tax=Cimex lectularius TaxID=79782 RepID=A0A8I6S8K8_CIMLE|nr:uncharacterized protein LOC106669889 isoform X2 [Cimex lectularius]